MQEGEKGDDELRWESDGGRDGKKMRQGEGEGDKQREGEEKEIGS